MDMVGHECIAIESDVWRVELGFGQDAGTELTDTFLGSKNKLAAECLGDDMVGDRWVYVASMTDLCIGRDVHLRKRAGILPRRE